MPAAGSLNAASVSARWGRVLSRRKRVTGRYTARLRSVFDASASYAVGPSCEAHCRAGTPAATILSDGPMAGRPADAEALGNGATISMADPSPAVVSRASRRSHSSVEPTRVSSETGCLSDEPGDVEAIDGCVVTLNGQRHERPAVALFVLPDGEDRCQVRPRVLDL